MLVYDDEGDDECDDVEIRYKKRESGDSCTVLDMVASQEECLLSLRQQIYHLTPHHYQAKAQAAGTSLN